MKFLRRYRTVQCFIAFIILFTIGRLCWFTSSSWNVLLPSMVIQPLEEGYNNTISIIRDSNVSMIAHPPPTITATTNTKDTNLYHDEGVIISPTRDPMQPKNHHVETEMEMDDTFTKLLQDITTPNDNYSAPTCRHWVVATWRTKPTNSSSSSTMETIRHVAETIISKEEGSAWCMVLVIAGWDNQEQEERLEEALEGSIQTMLSSLASRNTGDLYDTHKNKKKSIFILSTQSLKGNDDDDTYDATTFTSTTTSTDKFIAAVKIFLQMTIVVPSTSPSSSSSMPVPVLLRQQQSNLGNLFALLHGAKSILELQVDMLQFHSTRSNLWKDVYQMAAKSAAAISNSKVDQGSNVRLDSAVQIGLVGTHVWNPYLTDSSSATTMTTATRNTHPWYGILPSAFEVPSQAQAQQVAYVDPDVHLFFGKSTTGHHQHDHDNNNIENRDRTARPKMIGTISFVVKPSTSSSREGDGNGGAHDDDTGEVPVLIPSHASCPYTSYATWHLLPTLWSLVVPPSLISSSSSTNYEVGEQFRSFTTRWLLQDYNANLLVVQTHSSGTTLKESSLSSPPPPPPSSTTATATATEIEKEEKKIYNSQTPSHDKISRLLYWLHHSYDPTAVASSPSSSAQGHGSKTTAPHTIDIASKMEAMWISLHKMGILTERDVVLVQQWLKVLAEIKYTFPTRHRYKQYHVAAMGQFNVAPGTSARRVIYWVQHLRQYFHHVAVAGAFSPDVQSELKSNGIFVVPYQPYDHTSFSDDMDGSDKSKKTREKKNDRGYFSPMDNLAWMLKYYQNQNNASPSHKDHDGVQVELDHSPVKGVLYLHDDALINMTEWMKTGSGTNDGKDQPSGSLLFPTDAIIAYRGPSGSGTARLVYQPSKASLSPEKRMAKNDAAARYISQYSYNIHVTVKKDLHVESSSLPYYFTNAMGERFNSIEQLLTNSSLQPFGWYEEECIPGQVRIVQSAATYYFSSNISSPAITSHPPRGFFSDGSEDYDFHGIFQKHHHPDSDSLDISMRFACRGQSDLLYVPLSVSKEFATAVAMHTASIPKVFLECAMPTIVDMVYQVTHIPVRLVVLCTQWRRDLRGTDDMVRNCIRNPPVKLMEDQDDNETHDMSNKAKNLDWNFEPVIETNRSTMVKTFETYGIYHPFKLSKGFQRWSEMFEAVNET